MQTTLDDIAHSYQPMEVVDQIVDFWEEDDKGNSRRQEWLDALELFRATSSEDEVNKLARIVYLTLIAFGEELPDMNWVHVAVICDDLLRFGVPAWKQ